VSYVSGFVSELLMPIVPLGIASEYSGGDCCCDT
jgi:hypothetical protein